MQSFSTLSRCRLTLYMSKSHLQGELPNYTHIARHTELTNACTPIRKDKSFSLYEPGPCQLYYDFYAKRRENRRKQQELEFTDRTDQDIVALFDS